MDELEQVVKAVSVPVQAVGGLSLEQAISTPRFGAPLVVIGAPLVIDSDRFAQASNDPMGVLRRICQEVHGYGEVAVGRLSQTAQKYN
jgi:3-hexulose-6-phosphate synthase/6-phospho-3-hexuloisomerase